MIHSVKKLDLFARKLKEADDFLTQWQYIKTSINAMPENGYAEKLNATTEIMASHLSRDI